MKQIFLCIIVISFFTSLNLLAEQPNQRLFQLLTELEQRVINVKDIDNLQISDIESRVDELSQIISTLDDQSLVAAARSYRALTYQQLNNARFVRKQPDDQQQIDIGLDDFQFAIAKLPHNQFRSNLLYMGGLFALHAANLPKVATEYWHECATEQHGGCMNIMADGALSGRYGVAFSLTDAVYWHQQVVKNSDKLYCAGLYSSMRLAQLTYFWPELRSEKSWTQWLEQMQTFAEKYGRDSAEPLCAMVWYQSQALTFNQHGKKSIALESEVIKRISAGKPEQAIIEWLFDNSRARQAIAALPKLLEQGREQECSAAALMMVHSAFSNQHNVYKAAELRLFSGEDGACEDPDTDFIKLLQSEGKLP